jgi:hypothetical protein
MSNDTDFRDFEQTRRAARMGAAGVQAGEMIPSMVMVAALAAVLAAPSASDQANISLSMRVAAGVGDQMWPNWSKTPFVIDLLTANGPVMVNATEPSPAPSFPTNLEATFPLSNGVPTIVIGEPQFTAAKTPVRWSVTLLHEHFHQLQDSWPQYQAATAALGLAPADDKNAMWMLNYPFPYADPAVDEAYATMADALAGALAAIGTATFNDDVKAFLTARAAFQKSVGVKDYRYFTFQCWQEGVARYTEIAVARLAADEHRQDPKFLSDDEAAALSQDADATYTGVLKRLHTVPLKDGERSNFYAIGAGEAMLLDVLHPGWRLNYLDPRMDLDVWLRT